MRAAEAKVLFQQWRERQLRAKDFEAAQIVFVTLEQLVKEHLRARGRPSGRQLACEAAELFGELHPPVFRRSDADDASHAPANPRLRGLAQDGGQDPVGNGE